MDGDGVKLVPVIVAAFGYLISADRSLINQLRHIFDTALGRNLVSPFPVGNADGSNFIGIHLSQRGQALAGGICQKANAHGDGGNHRQKDDPESGLFVTQHGFDPAFDSHLAESQGTGGNPFVGHAASQQRFRILLFATGVQILDYLFVTGHFDVPAQQNIGKPKNRVEPVDAQKGEAQGLPPMIFPLDVGVLMGQNVIGGLWIQIRGQVDLGLPNAQNKGRADVVAQVKILTDLDGHPHPSPQDNIANQGIDRHGDYTNEPHPGENERPDLGGIGAGHFRWSQAFRDHRIESVIQSGDAGIDLGVSGVEKFLRQRFGAWNETQHAFNGEGEDQPQPYQPPKNAADGFGRFFQQNPE